MLLESKIQIIDQLFRDKLFRLFSDSYDNYEKCVRWLSGYVQDSTLQHKTYSHTCNSRPIKTLNLRGGGDISNRQFMKCASFSEIISLLFTFFLKNKTQEYFSYFKGFAKCKNLNSDAESNVNINYGRIFHCFE